MVEEVVGDAIVGDSLVPDGATINVLSWNVRGLNCPDKRGNVKWVLRRCSYDVAILQDQNGGCYPF